MKKILSAVLVCVLLVGCVFALASCGKTLSGEYKLDATGEIAGIKSGVVTTYKFSGSKVTLTIDTYVANNKSTVEYDGKYTIEEVDEDYEITFTFTDEDGEEVKDYSKTQVLKIDDEKKTITIGLVTYTKAE